MSGSASWKNISRGWASMQKWLLPRKPANLAEWGDLPLWRPHLNHVNRESVGCTTLARRSLRDCGLRRMGDILGPRGEFISWNEARGLGARAFAETTFQDLLRNLWDRPTIRHPEEQMEFYMEATEVVGKQLVWQYQLPARLLTEAWIPFLDRSKATRTFLREGVTLRPIACCFPGPTISLRRIMVGSPRYASKFIHFGPWQEGNGLLSQYQWLDGTQLVNTSTAQLRLLSTRQATRPHTPLPRWRSQFHPMFGNQHG